MPGVKGLEGQVPGESGDDDADLIDNGLRVILAALRTYGVSVRSGPLAARPAASAATLGWIYVVTDTTPRQVQTDVGVGYINADRVSQVARRQGDNQANVTAQAHYHYQEPGITVDPSRSTRFAGRWTLIGTDTDQLCLVQWIVNGNIVDQDRVTVPAGHALPFFYEWEFGPGELDAGPSTFGFIASTVDQSKQITLLNSGGFVFRLKSHEV